ncbi:MAG TPA: hypothetical protein VGI58_21075 [Streptosporangiaceae bacterium]|jgi:hypothetical protein
MPETQPEIRPVQEPRYGRSEPYGSPHAAVRRRDERLARIRKLTLWVFGGAAGASLGLGVAFAHALPGHAATAPSTPVPASSSSAPPAGHHPAARVRHHDRLSTPKQQPTTPKQQPQQPAHTKPPVVSSGGS